MRLRSLVVLLLALIASSAYAQTTVTIGANTGDTFSGVEDTRLRLIAPTTNFSGNSTFEVHKFSVSDWAHSVIRFTGLSNITPPVDVTSATLNIWCSDQNSGPSQTVAARRLLRAWVNAQVTWNVYSNGNNWGTAGGTSAGVDRESTPAGTSAAIGSAGSYKAISIDPALVEGWINGTIDNNGLHLERADGSNDSLYMTFISSEGANTNRPYLSVTYTTSAPEDGLLMRRRRQ